MLIMNLHQSYKNKQDWFGLELMMKCSMCLINRNLCYCIQNVGSSNICIWHLYCLISHDSLLLYYYKYIYLIIFQNYVHKQLCCCACRNNISIRTYCFNAGKPWSRELLSQFLFSPNLYHNMQSSAEVSVLKLGLSPKHILEWYKVVFANWNNLSRWLLLLSSSSTAGSYSVSACVRSRCSALRH